MHARGVGVLTGHGAGSLSGTVFMQLVFYFRLYPRDALRIKSMVRVVGRVGCGVHLYMEKFRGRLGYVDMVRSYLVPRLQQAHMRFRVLDMFHTTMIYLACWDYLITNWARDAIFDYIPWCAFSRLHRLRS